MIRDDNVMTQNTWNAYMECVYNHDLEIVVTMTYISDI